MCKEWTKPFKETNPIYLDNYKKVIKKCNKDKLGISGVVEVDGHGPTSYSFTYNLLEKLPSFRTLVTSEANS